MKIDKQLLYLISIYFVATVCTFALDWQLPGFQQVAEFSKKIDLDRYLIQDYMTYWQLTHYLTRVCLGFFCPKYWKIIFIIDFGWETLECIKWNAHNWYDLIWNMLGLITGIMLRHYKIFDRFLPKDEQSKSDENTVNKVEPKDTTANQADMLNQTNIQHNDNADKNNYASSHTSSHENSDTSITNDIDNELIKNTEAFDISSPEENNQHIKNIYFDKNSKAGIEVGDGNLIEITKRKKDKKKKKKKI